MFNQTEQTQFFESILFNSLGKNTQINNIHFISGGCINNAVKLETNLCAFFVKWNIQDLENMFQIEAKSLNILRKANEFYIPEVIGFGKYLDKAYLTLEFIDEGFKTEKYWQNFGVALAKLHQHQGVSFGLDFDNYIGSLIQHNDYLEDGIQFFIEKRLRTQAGLALYNHKISKTLYDRLEQFYKFLPDLLPQEKPSLLHGDLWSGNAIIGKNNEPVLIDPAIYYGNREIEIAFTKLFGGFSKIFYNTYEEAYPLEKGFQQRIEIYNLYPLLVHVNLFGKSYLSGIEKVLKKYLD